MFNNKPPQKRGKGAGNRPTLHDEYTSYYQNLDRFCTRHGMSLESVKILKNAMLSVVVVVFGYIMVRAGADPSLVAGLVLSLIALLNGIELSEWLAVYSEVQQARIDNDDGEGGE